MSALTESANITYRDSEVMGAPSTGEHEPEKPAIRRLFALIDLMLASLGVNGAITVKKATRALLFADLAYAADTLAVVYNDVNPALNGIYAKVGASGAGSWSLTGLALPSSFATMLSAVLASTEEAETNALSAAQSAAQAQALLDQIEAIIAAGEPASIAACALRDASNLTTQDIIDFNVVLDRNEAKRTFVVLSSGQSNMANRLAYDLDIPPNFLMWDFWAQATASNVTGGPWAAPDGTQASVSMAFCARVARENPDWTVYLIDVSRGGLEVANWGASPPTYNMREAFDSNVLTALNAIAPGTNVDLFMWWQGESDVTVLSEQQYLNAYNDFQTWLRGKPWYPATTQQLVFGIAPYTSSLFYNYSGVMRGVVCDKPSLRKFVDTRSLDISFWDPIDGVPYIHMTADGYAGMGEYAADVWAGKETLLPGWGLYIPTLTAVANVTSSAAELVRWTRIGDLVRVCGRILVTPTVGSATTTRLGISVPFSSNFTVATADCSGRANTQFGLTGAINADITNDRAELQFAASSVASWSFYFEFEYVVK